MLLVLLCPGSHYSHVFQIAEQQFPASSNISYPLDGWRFQERHLFTQTAGSRYIWRVKTAKQEPETKMAADALSSSHLVVHDSFIGREGGDWDHPQQIKMAAEALVSSSHLLVHDCFIGRKGEQWDHPQGTKVAADALVSSGHLVYTRVILEGVGPSQTKGGQTESGYHIQEAKIATD